MEPTAAAGAAGGGRGGAASAAATPSPWLSREPEQASKGAMGIGPESGPTDSAGWLDPIKWVA